LEGDGLIRARAKQGRVEAAAGQMAMEILIVCGSDRPFTCDQHDSGLDQRLEISKKR
jgi:hypothetical protein